MLTHWHTHIDTHVQPLTILAIAEMKYALGKTSFENINLSKNLKSHVLSISKKNVSP